MPAPLASIHGYAGYMKIGAFRCLCREGASMAMPRALDLPYPISVQRFGLLNYGDGFRFPVLQAPAIIMDMGTDDATIPSWFDATNMNLWFTNRGAAPAYDTPEISGDIEFSDNGISGGAGIGTYRIVQAKGAGFSLNVNQGSPIGCTLRFAGTDRQTATITPPTVGLPGTPIQADRVSLGGGLANKGIIGISLDYDAGLTPNMSLNGKNRPDSHNADIPTCTMSIRCYTDNTVNAPGFIIGTDGVEPIYPEVLDATISIVRRKLPTLKTMTIAVSRMILIDPDDRRQSRGRIVRTYRYNCIATQAAYPLVITES